MVALTATPSVGSAIVSAPRRVALPAIVAVGCLFGIAHVLDRKPVASLRRLRSARDSAGRHLAAGLTRAIATWFEHHRGLALAIAISGDRSADVHHR